MADAAKKGGTLNAITVLLAYSPAPRQVHEMTLILPAGACVRDALVAAGQDDAFAGLQCGIWNRSARLDQALSDGDRLEIYRPLRIDPKVARRERFKKQGAKSAGLFAQRRPGAKAGY